MTFTAVLLICSMSLSHEDCTQATATFSMLSPETHSEIECMREGQQLPAQTEMRPRFGEEYLMVTCSRDIQRAMNE